MSAGYIKPGPKATGGRGEIARGTVEEVADGASRGSGDRAASRGGTKSGVRKASKTAATARAPGRTPKPSERLFSMADFSISDPEQLQTLMNESMQGFAVELGVQMAVCLLQDNVLTLCGAKSERVLDRTASRHGSQEGYVILGGQKVAIRRPRVRSAEGEECELDVYSKLQSEHAMPHAALTRMVRGVSCRDYATVVETARAGFGVKKSSVSKHFIKASSEQLAEFDERRFDNLTFAAIFIDGVNFGGEMLVVALGVDSDGSKHVLGLRQGETENAEVVTALLSDLHDRGIRTNRPTLFCLDGSKALRAAVLRIFGMNAVIQRCQLHKIRNVEGHLAKKHQPEARRRMNEAYAQKDVDTAKRLLGETVTWLRTINRDAAASLEEGLKETLTVIRLGLTGDLRRFFSSTNAIESMFSRVRQVTGRVKRWQGGDMRHRWCVSGLIRAEFGFRKIRGFKELPTLFEALTRFVLDKSENSRSNK